MSTKPSDAFMKFKTFFEGQSVSLINALLSILTLCGEEIFRNLVFECPCDLEVARSYTIWAAVGPAGVLFIIGIFINAKTWRLTQGWYKSKEQTWCNCLYFSLEIILRALIAPGAWIFFMLINGSYYTCYMLSKPCDYEATDLVTVTDNKVTDLVTVTTAASVDLETLKYRYYHESQNIAWQFLLGSLAVALGFFLLVRCLSSETYLRKKYRRALQMYKKEKFDELLQTKAKEVAVDSVNEFFDAPEQPKETWDKHAILLIDHVAGPIPFKGKKAPAKQSGDSKDKQAPAKQPEDSKDKQAPAEQPEDSKDKQAPAEHPEVPPNDSNV